MNGKVIAIVNRKGGSGKTTTSKNLAYDLTLHGNKVLLIDADPQCNATDGLSVAGRNYKKTILGLLRCESINRCIYHTRFKNLDIIPGSDYLASEDVMDDIFINQLKNVADVYDYIIFDTSPYFNKLTVEILKTHDLVIIPTEIAEDSVKGMMITIREMLHLFHTAKFRILYTKIDTSRETEKALKELYKQLGNVSFKGR